MKETTKEKVVVPESAITVVVVVVVVASASPVSAKHITRMLRGCFARRLRGLEELSKSMTFMSGADLSLLKDKPEQIRIALLQLVHYYKQVLDMYIYTYTNVYRNL